ncbi:MAG: helix-turn-helix transcriptional regulator [Lachnospiraceae bacterium]|nr:helix-turn-helix transcriptional regulator [Lachnospiraceae bacterium]
MYEETFALRLTHLRTQKNVSAREMSLSIGQNPGYINNIESGKALPSMTVFFYICEYLGISPQEFFDSESKQPVNLQQLIENLKKLTPNQLSCISMLVAELIKKA